MSMIGELRNSLQTHWGRLQEQWRASGELWKDPVRQQFEREFWQEFQEVIPTTLEEMERLDEVFARARRAVR